ncbi:MAG: hypothetical protein AAGM22_17590 [Acidobacteriota bacterium]
MFRLKETCRFWAGKPEGNQIIRVDDHEYWHHQIRLGGLPTFYAMTRSTGGDLDEELEFCEMGEGELPVKFEQMIRWLDSESEALAQQQAGAPSDSKTQEDQQILQELQNEEILVRLLGIEDSFFHGLSFHRQEELLFVLPLDQPTYLFAGTGHRRFLTPYQLAQQLRDAPSFLGVG